MTAEEQAAATLRAAEESAPSDLWRAPYDAALEAGMGCSTSVPYGRTLSSYGETLRYHECYEEAEVALAEAVRILRPAVVTCAEEDYIRAVYRQAKTYTTQKKYGEAIAALESVRPVIHAPATGYFDATCIRIALLLARLEWHVENRGACIRLRNAAHRKAIQFLGNDQRLLREAAFMQRWGVLRYEEEYPTFPLDFLETSH